MSFFKKLADVFTRITSKPEWRVEIAESGRDGHVIYREPAGSITFYWEFGGGDVVAIISGEKAKDWKKNHRWAATRQHEILQRVAQEIVRQKAPNSRAEIDEQLGCIYIR